MARNPQIAARTKLEQSVTMYERAIAASLKTRDAMHDSMVKAVEAGLTRGEVAKIVGVSQARVAQIPGMPPGQNVHKKDID